MDIKSSMTSIHKHRILVVDDDPQVFKIISRLLDSEKYEVEAAGDGPEALRKIQHNRPELLILDLMMPGMSGIEVCQKVKNSAGNHPIMVLVLSAKDAQVDRRKCFEMGADDFETKPFHIATLARKIDRMFEKKVKSQESGFRNQE
jgi:DNA-binding response OmpR family regulator